jgi:hypothetical protein
MKNGTRTLRITAVILAFVFCGICLPGLTKASAAGKSYTFSCSGTISGTAGTELTESVYTISFKNGTEVKKVIPKDLEITDWFSGENSVFVPGLHVYVAEDAAAGAKALKIRVTGIPYGGSSDNITMRVRNIYFDNDETDLYAWADVTFTGGKPKFAITRQTYTQPDGTGAVGDGIYFTNSDGSTGNSGWKLNATKGVKITSGNELTVYIDGYFIQSLAKGTNISSWFTGTTWGTNSLLNYTVTSFLPEGVTAKLKNAVSVGDRSFTIVFEGTPTKGSRDLIAFTIPKGYTCHKGKYGSVADSVDGFTVTNMSGKYAYNIPYDDYIELYSQYIKVTYPKLDLPNGTVLTAEDNVYAEYELIGYTSSGAKLVFQGFSVGANFKNLTVQEQYQYGGTYHYRPSDVVGTSTGLTTTVSEISADRTKIKVLLTGQVNLDPGIYTFPFNVGIYPFAMEVSYTNAGHYVQGFLENEHEFRITQPDPGMTLSQSVNIVNTGVPWERPSIDHSEVVIDLGDDSLAMDLAKGTSLALCAKTKPGTRTGEIIYYTVTSSLFTATTSRAAKAGDKKIYITITPTMPNQDFCGFVELGLDKSYLTKAGGFGSQGAYFFKDGSIYIDVKKHVDYYATCSELIISGSVTEEWTTTYHYDSEGNVTEGQTLDFAGIGSGKVYFTVTTIKDIHVDKNYAKGDDVRDLIRLPNAQSSYPNRLYYCTGNPFYNKDYAASSAWYTMERLYHIRAAEAITKDPDGVASAHTFKLYIDLSEFIVLSPLVADFELVIYDSIEQCNQRIYAEKVCKFNIAPEGEIPEKPEQGSSGSGAAENDGIDYSGQQDVIIYAKDDEGKPATDVYINMTQEKLVTEFDYKWYSVAGGVKWKEAKKPLTDKQFQSLLNKNMTLWLTDKYDKKAKKPADDAVVFKFDTTLARPKAPKLKVEYESYADNTGSTPGQWGLADKDLNPISEDELAALEIAVVAADKKNISEKGFGAWPAQGGLAVSELSNNKQTTVFYYVRIKATETSPASKMVKISVKGEQKAPNLKADYKKESIKLKDGMYIYFGDTSPSALKELAADAVSFEDYDGKVVYIATKDAAKQPVSISGYLTETRNTVLIWTAATKKKPATAVQSILLAARAVVKNTELEVSKGKAKLDTKKYEVYNEKTGKWGSLPKVTESCELKVRIKPTAKGGKEDDKTFAASSEATLVITWGVYDEAKKKSGITAAEIVTEPAAGQ